MLDGRLDFGVSAVFTPAAESEYATCFHFDYKIVKTISRHA